MFYALLANLVLAAHLAFIIFTILGGLLTLKWPRIWMVHAPVLVWAFLVEFLMWSCPLTGLENMLRARAGQAGYEQGLVDHLLSSVIYPGLPPEIHLYIGIFLVVVNIAVYSLMFRRGALSFTGTTYEA